MRMWNISTRLLCDKHLLGEHVEMHMFAGAIKKGMSIMGYINTGLVEVHNIQNRHDELAAEMESRGMKHKSELQFNHPERIGYVDALANVQELSRRCDECRLRICNANIGFSKSL